MRTKLTAFNNYIERTKIGSEKLAELPSRLEKAESLWQEFDIVQTRIEYIDDCSTGKRKRSL